MNDKIVFGQYIYRNSIIHKLDPRVKIRRLIYNDDWYFFNPQR